MALELFVNDPGTTLAAAISSTGATTLQVSSGTGYPASGNFRIRIDSEIMIVTGVSGTTWTVTRGAESTAAAVHSNGAIVNHVLTAGGYRQAVADRTCNVLFRAALIQAGTANLGFSIGSDGPTAVDLTGTNNIAAGASFPAASLKRVYDHFTLPSDWVAPMDLDIIWQASAITGNVTWQVETAAAGTAAVFDPSWNSANTVTTTVAGTTNQISISQITGLTTTGLAADKEFVFRFSRSAGDTCASAAILIGLRFVLHRTP